MIIDDDPIVVKIYYKKNGRNYSAITEQDFNEKTKAKDFKSEEFKNVTIKMKPMTWGLYNELQEKYTSSDDPITGKNSFNFRIYKEERLKNLILEWDATVKDSNNEQVPLPVTTENIMKLAPEVAETILLAYDMATLLTGEEEKKS